MSAELKTLMQAYSARGFDDWKGAGYRVQSEAKRCLANEIVENEWEISQVMQGKQRKFIPMPRHGYKKLDWCFFWPRKVRGELRSLLLFILVNGANRHCLAFRFEGAARGAHAYTHLQLTARWGKSIAQLPGVASWLPASYPAFPIPAENWTELFLVMATAVHGRCGGIGVLIQEIFGSATGMPLAIRFNSLLESRLVKLERDTNP